jgi:hypothetical protein
MTRKDQRPTPSIAVKLCIWSIRHQAWLAGQVRIYIYGATALVALLALADVISIETAMFSAFCGGAVLLGLIWTLVQQRRSMLLNIQEPEVREEVYKAMLTYLRQVDHGISLRSHGNDAYKENQKDCKNCKHP